MSDDTSPPCLDEDIAAYYAHAPEEIRLRRGAAQLEFARTCEILDRVAPPAPAVVLDVGGGSGPYACRLLAAAISCFASLFEGLARDLLGDADFALIVEQDLARGRHCNPTARPDYFTTAYFHHPAGRERLLRAARAIESEPALLGVSAHLLGVGRRA